jgi:hypothetical protein
MLSRQTRRLFRAEAEPQQQRPEPQRRMPHSIVTLEATFGKAFQGGHRSLKAL